MKRYYRYVLRHAILLKPMQHLYIFAAQYLIVFSPLVALITWFFSAKPIKKKIVWLSVVALPLAYITAKLSGKIIYDPRPFVVDHIAPLIPHAPDNGFPSDHMLLTMTVASIIFVYNKKMGIVLGLIALAVGTGRVLVHVHHIEDIAGSAVIAIGITYLSWFILSLLSKKFPKFF